MTSTSSSNPDARGKAARRPSQAQRRDATRTRILDATLYCLAHHGYAGTSLSQVTVRAKVSRGAWAHHFASMDALLLAAAEHLMHQVYQRLASVLGAVAASGDDLRGLVGAVWREFFASEVNEVYLELLIASRRNPALAERLRVLALQLESNIANAATQLFEAQPDAVHEVTTMMHLNRWMLRGIALDAPLMPEGSVDEALQAWSALVSTQLRRRRSSTRG
jgi:AcrR family transcriptional regulator